MATGAVSWCRSFVEQGAQRATESTWLRITQSEPLSTYSLRRCSLPLSGGQISSSGHGGKGGMSNNDWVGETSASSGGSLPRGWSSDQDAPVMINYPTPKERVNRTYPDSRDRLGGHSSLLVVIRAIT